MTTKPQRVIYLDVIHPHWRTIIPPADSVNHPIFHAPAVPGHPAANLTPVSRPSSSSGGSRVLQPPSQRLVPSTTSESEFPAVGSPASTAQTSVVNSRAASTGHEVGKSRGLDRFVSMLSFSSLMAGDNLHSVMAQASPTASFHLHASSFRPLSAFALRSRRHCSAPTVSPSPNLDSLPLSPLHTFITKITTSSGRE